MRKAFYLFCLTLILLITGCNAQSREPQPSANQGVVGKSSAPVETAQAPTPSKDPVSRFPEPIGKISKDGITLTVQNTSKQTVASLDKPQGVAIIPMDIGGYEIEVLLDEQYKATDCRPKVDSQTWRFITNSGASYATAEGITVLRFSVGINDGFKPPIPVDAPLDVPIIITLPGLKNAKGEEVPADFTLHPEYVIATIRDSQHNLLGCDVSGEAVEVDLTDTYDIDIIFQKPLITADVSVGVESDAWQIDPDFPEYRIGDGTIGIRLVLEPKDRSENRPLSTPIKVVVTGVRKDEASYPVDFTLVPKEKSVTPTRPSNYPGTWAKLPEHDMAILTLRGTSKEMTVSLSPTENIPIPLDKGGYEAEIIVNKRYRVEGFPQIASKAWRVVKNSDAKWVTDGGEQVFRFRISSREGLASEDPVNTSLEVPVQVTIPGVKDGETVIPLFFNFYVDDPHSKYGIVYQGKVVDDERLQASRPELVNGNLELVVFSLPNEIAADRYVALCNTEQKQTLFVADLKTFAGHGFWTGWLNDREFYIANNYNLAVYDIYGEKREVFRLADGNIKNAIHGLAWLKETQTMALLYCDGKTDGIELKLLTNELKATQTVAVVDRQDWYRGGSERFPMQILPMSWDDTGERLAFTKTKDHSLAIYDRKTGAVEDVEGVSQVSKIEYDATTKQFVTSSK